MMPISLNTPSRIQDNLGQMVESMLERGMRRPTRHARTGSYPLAAFPQRYVVYPNSNTQMQMPMQLPPYEPPQNNPPGAFAVNMDPPPTTDSAPSTTDETNSDNPLQNIRAMWRASQYALPFLLLLLVKVFYEHRLGILVLVGLSGTFYHANSSLKKHTSQRDSRTSLDNMWNLLWVIVFLSGNIFFIYYVFDKEQLYRSLYFMIPLMDRMDLWNLLWVVGITDFIIKYATIITKAGLALLPRSFLPYKRKGKYFMLIEFISQFYRCVVPAPPWLVFLLDDQRGGQYVSYLLVIVFFLIKGNHLYGKYLEVRQALAKWQVDVSYGSPPTQEKLEAADHMCPICQDKFAEPIMLSCSHVFCEDCVSLWLSREPTCPMCRAKITDDPTWRDGTTSSNMQIY